MHTLQVTGAYLAAHWQAIAAALTALMSFVGTLKGLFSTHPKVEGALDKTLDVLSFVARAGAKGVPMLGRISVPGLPSRPVAALKPDLKAVT